MTNPENPFTLPRFIFLNGPKASGKTTLATLLCSEDPEMLLVSHIDPVRMMLMSIFYPDDLMAGSGPDLSSETLKRLQIPLGGEVFADENPGCVLSHREWMVQAQWWLRKLHGEDILARLADATVQRNEYFYQRFIFDGSREEEDITFFSRKYGAASCLIVQLYRKDTSWSDDIGKYHAPLGVPLLSIMNNDSPLSMLNTLRSASPHPEVPAASL